MAANDDLTHSPIAAQTVEESREGAVPYTLKVEFPQFEAAAGAWADEINLVLGGWAMEQVLAFRKQSLALLDDAALGAAIPDGSRNGLYVTYAVPLRERNLLSIEFHLSSYGAGAAHPNETIVTRNFALDLTVELTLADLFRPGVDWLALLSQRCIADLQRQASEDGVPPLSDWIERGAGPQPENYTRFRLTPSALVILFDADTVGPHAWGAREVEIAYTKLIAELHQDGLLSPLLM